MSALYDLFHQVFEQPQYTLNGLNRYLNDRVRLKSFPKGTAIVTVHQPVAHTYLVLEGEYAETDYAQSGRNRLVSHGAPQLIGIVALVERLARHAGDSVALSDVTALAIDNEYLYEQLEQDGRLGLIVMKNLTGKVIAASNQARFRAFFSSKDHFIIYIYEDWKVSGAALCGHSIKKTNARIADEIGISERTVYRILNKLCEEGVLSIAGGQILLDQQNLALLKARYNALLSL